MGRFFDFCYAFKRSFHLKLEIYCLISLTFYKTFHYVSSLLKLFIGCFIVDLPEE